MEKAADVCYYQFNIYQLCSKLGYTEIFYCFGDQALYFWIKQWKRHEGKQIIVIISASDTVHLNFIFITTENGCDKKRIFFFWVDCMHFILASKSALFILLLDWGEKLFSFILFFCAICELVMISQISSEIFPSHGPFQFLPNDSWRLFSEPPLLGKAWTSYSNLIMS